MNPLLAACQLVNVSEPGHAPPLADAQEDMRLLHHALADKHSESPSRQLLSAGTLSGVLRLLNKSRMISIGLESPSRLSPSTALTE